MATKTVSKQGLRATATAKTAKAAQRTPLPAKAAKHAETIELAKEAVAEATTPKQRSKAAKAAPAPKKSAPAAKPPRQVTKDEAITEASSKFDKAGVNAPKFRELGWDVVETRDGAWVELIATRGTEVIHQGWLNGVYDTEHSATYTIGDRTVKTRNLAEALRWGGRSEADAAKEYTKVNSNKMFRPRAQAPADVASLPFDINGPDEDIIAALAGKSVRWVNVYRVEEEDATVPKSSPWTRVQTAPDGNRMLLFCCPTSGFRAFRLTALRRVGRTRVGLAA